jgi:hypothetical protein
LCVLLSARVWAAPTALIRKLQYNSNDSNNSISEGTLSPSASNTIFTTLGTQGQESGPLVGPVLRPAWNCLKRKYVSATDDVGGKLHLSNILLAVSPAQLTPTEGVLPNENVYVVFSSLQQPAIKISK